MNSNTFRISRRDTALGPICAALAQGACALETSPGMQQMPVDASRVASHPACAGSPGLPCEVVAFVANLPCQQRAALMLRRFHQRGYADIAATLGCTEHEARESVHEALRSLRAHLGDQI